MENHSSPAEELPALYRAVLDGVAQLEALGDRGEAQRLRAEAIRVYSTAWDEGGRRRLIGLVRRLDRLTTGGDPARTDGARRWPRARWLPAR